MATLTEQLREQHRALEELAAGLDAALARGDPSDIGYALVRLNRAIASHTETEEVEIYDALGQASELTGLTVPTEVAAAYARHQSVLDSAMRGFFERHRAAPRSLESLRSEWPEIRRLLLERIHFEEETLYPMFESWTPDEAPAQARTRKG